jgi:multimeric flavodoxin WrbA/nitrite reductase/ring-hydroxylating ferredoxin subunit
MWHDLGPTEHFTARPLTAATIGTTKLVISHVDGQFGALSGTCNHAGGPLAEGRLDGEYIVCPWHNWKYHCRTGKGEPGYEADAVPQYELKLEGGRLWISDAPPTKRTHGPHPKHPLSRRVERAPGPIRVVGISTTNMDVANPRYSTSDALLTEALSAAESTGAETQLIKLAELKFRPCEGYYSKSAHACTWPCSITQMDPDDEMERVYEAMVHWADVVLLATPIRWGTAGSLYFRMVERLNCVQNQVTIANRVLIRNKVASFIITGGQDNVQAVAGQLLGFFAEIGFHFPQFPYIAHSRGWTAEDMEQNVVQVRGSRELHEAARSLAIRSVDQAQLLLDHESAAHANEHAHSSRMPFGGRKAHQLTAEELGADEETAPTVS